MITTLEEELNRTLTTEQITMILDFSIQAAEDNGFISSFIFQRALYVFAAIILYPDRKEEISNLIGNDNDIRLIWDVLVKDGTAERMNKEFAADMDYLGNVGEDWYNEYVDYAHSARGLLGIFNNFSGEVAQEALSSLKEISNSGFSDIVEIAKNWGSDRLMQDNPNTMHEYLQGLNDGTIKPSENMPNFKVLPKEEGEEV